MFLYYLPYYFLKDTFFTFAEYKFLFWIFVLYLKACIESQKVSVIIRLHFRVSFHSIINKKIIAASKIYQLLIDTDISDARCLATSDAEVVEVIVKEDAKITKGKIKELDIPKGLTLGGLVRDGVGQIINGDTEIKANDRVLIICVNDILHKIEKLFG